MFIIVKIEILNLSHVSFNLKCLFLSLTFFILDVTYDLTRLIHY